MNAPKIATDALERIAKRSPTLEGSIHGPRWRCFACGHAWADGVEPEHHDEDCGYLVVQTALATEAIATASELPELPESPFSIPIHDDDSGKYKFSEMVYTAEMVRAYALATIHQPAQSSEPQDCIWNGAHRCVIGPHGPGGTLQCEYCGAPPREQPARDEREAFEALCRNRRIDLSVIPENERWGSRIYKHDAVQIAWEAWEERAALSPEQAIRAFMSRHTQSNVDRMSIADLHAEIDRLSAPSQAASDAGDAALLDWLELNGGCKIGLGFRGSHACDTMEHTVTLVMGNNNREFIFSSLREAIRAAIASQPKPTEAES